MDLNQIDYKVGNILVTEYFLLNGKELKYCSHFVYYILSNIFSRYFSQVLNKQKIKYWDGHYLPKYIK